MLEPWVRPGLALTGYVVLATLSAISIVTDGTLTTRNGTVPFRVLMPFALVFFGVRLAGLAAARARGGDTMTWSPRAASWLALAAFLFMAGLLDTPWGLLIMSGFILADVAGARAAKRPTDAPRTAPSPFPWLAQLKFPLVIAGYALFVVVFHFLVARRFPFGYLLDWTLVALGFAVGVRYLLGFERASEQAAIPPPAHRVHQVVERHVEDPGRARAENAARAFLTTGDVEQLLAIAREAARFARLEPAQTRALEASLQGALQRPGTSREDDLEAALAALERAFGPSTLTGVKP